MPASAPGDEALTAASAPESRERRTEMPLRGQPAGHRPRHDGDAVRERRKKTWDQAASNRGANRSRRRPAAMGPSADDVTVRPAAVWFYFG